MLHYMRKQDRGVPKPIAGKAGRTQSTRVGKETTWLAGTKGVFNSTDPHPTLISNIVPLMDRSNTPRQATREITLERNFTNKRWLYNKNTSDDFNPNHSKKEIARSKLMRKITRKEDKAKTGNNASKFSTSKVSA